MYDTLPFKSSVSVRSLCLLWMKEINNFIQQECIQLFAIEDAKGTVKELFL